MGDHLTSEHFEGVLLFRRQGAGFVGNDTERPHFDIVIYHQGDTGIELDLRFARHERIIVKAQVLSCIFDQKQLVIQNGMGTKGKLPGSFLGCQTIVGFKPLAIAIDQTH